MKRLEAWPEKLAAYLDAQREKAFVWGEHDCAHFGAGAIEAMTGEPLQLPKYSTALGAEKLMRRHGGLAAMVAKLTGCEEISPLAAMRGDLVLAEVEGKQVLGLVNLRGVLSVLTVKGLTMAPRKCAVRAWKVGL